MGADIKNRKLYCIVNPGAGGGNTSIWWNNIMPALDAKGYNYFWEESKPGQAPAQVKQAIMDKGAEAVVVVGGDGSLYQAVNGMVENDRLIKDDIVLAALPVGSARDFAHFLYGSTQSEILRLLDDGIVKNIDIGKCTYQGKDSSCISEYFINSFDAGAGADTCTAVNANDGQVKRRFKNGKTAFMLTALKVLMTFNYTETKVEIADESFAGEYIIIGIANGQYVGGGMNLFPKAKLDDGLLDLVLVPRKSRLEILTLFSKVYGGSFLDIEGVVYRQTKQVKISTGRPIDIELDGEVPGTTNATISVVPQVLPILAFS